jgi:hypothetical protein
LYRYCDTTNTTKSQIGHGVVMKRGEAFFILSVAHVLVAFMGEESIIMKWTTGQVDTDVDVGCFFLPETYVKLGRDDIACVQIFSVIADALESMETQEVELCDRQILTGNMLVGHGTMFLNGPVRCVLENSSRFLVGTESAPGCSGCPFFDKDANLAGLLHGDAKHRDKQSSADDSLELLTHAVYADNVGSGLALRPIPMSDGVYTSLRNVDAVPDDILNNPEEPMSSFGGDVLNALEEIFSTGTILVGQSLNKIRSGVAEEVWPKTQVAAANAASIRFGNKITLLLGVQE